MSRLFVIGVCLAWAALAGAADWPQFRGPNRDNISPDKGLRKTWLKSVPKLLWQSTPVGQGYSSVAVVGDRVYTMGNRNETAYIFALNRKTGKSVWEAKIGEGGGRGGYPGTRCTPTVDGDLVYAVGPVGDLVCVAASSGKEKWRKSFAEDYKGPRPRWDFAESPLVDGDRLVCVPGGRTATVLVLDKKSGNEIWKAPIGDTAGYSSVVISNAAGVKQYVTLTSKGTIGVRASDGKLLWRYERLANNTANIPTPIVKDDQVFTAAGYGKGAALLTLSKSSDGVTFKEEYYNADMRNKHGGLVIVGDYVYGDTDDRGRPFCADWKTGKVKWTRNGTGKGRGSASLTYADGHLYVHYANGVVALVPATPKGYSEKGSFKIPNSNANSWAHPVVIDGKLYLREKSIVWCYDVK